MGWKRDPREQVRAPDKGGRCALHRTKGLAREEQRIRVREGFLSEERGSYGMGGPSLEGAVCSSGGALVKGARREGPFLKGSSVHSWRWEVIWEKGLHARKGAQSPWEA